MGMRSAARQLIRVGLLLGFVLVLATGCDSQRSNLLIPTYTAAPTLLPPEQLSPEAQVALQTHPPTRESDGLTGATSTQLPTPTLRPSRTPPPGWRPTETPTVTPSLTPTGSPTPSQATPSPNPLPDYTPISQVGSKLGLHVIQNNSPLIMEFVRQAQPAVVKAVGDLGWLSEVKEVSPGTVTIGRLMARSQDMVGDPIQAADEFVAAQLPDYLANPGVDYWEGWNEPDPDENMAWYADFEEERARMLAAYGLRAAVGGFSAGVPEVNQFFFFLPAIEAAWQYGGVLSLHEYAAPTMDYLVGDPLPGWEAYADRGPLALRYRWWYEDILIPRGTLVPLVITEAGIDGIVMNQTRPGPAGLGWRDFLGYWESIGLGSGSQAYIDQLAWYDSHLRRDFYVIGFTVFTAGGGSQWQTYDVTSILPALAAYVTGGG